MQRPETASGRAHEETDANAGLLAKLAFLGILTILLVIASMLFLLRGTVSREAVSDAGRPSEAAGRPSEAAVPASHEGPHLQVDPAEAVRRARTREEEILASYGWVRREGGVVRIPVERAKELLVERGVQPSGSSEPEPPP